VKFFPIPKTKEQISKYRSSTRNQWDLIRTKNNENREADEFIKNSYEKGDYCSCLKNKKQHFDMIDRYSEMLHTAVENSTQNLSKSRVKRNLPKKQLEIYLQYKQNLISNTTLCLSLLWYFNFVQVPSMPKIPDEQKPAITKVIAPAVLFWFRWSALSTIITGLIVAYLNDYIHEALALGIGSGGGKNTAIGIGMWLGLIMAFNVWVIIWPNRKKSFRNCGNIT
jgi:hypothetical protein